MTTMTWTCRICRGPASYPSQRCAACEGSLFSMPADPMVRHDSRETSKAAAKSVNVNHREEEIVNALRRLVTASSAYEIQQCLNDYGIPRDKNCVSRRLTSLVRKGIVLDSGLKPGPYGRDVTSYRLAS